MKEHEGRLIEIIKKNEALIKVLEVLKGLDLPFNYYVGAGCITNTVWNYYCGYPLSYGISDVDIVYFDSEDLSSDSEQKFKDLLIYKLDDFPFKIDVKNQARVHLWYEKKFGFPIQPYESVEDAIDSWPTTATSLGVRQELDNSYKIYAPFNLDDVFSMVIKPNKKLISQEIYEKKAFKWHQKWPKLTILPW